MQLTKDILLKICPQVKNADAFISAFNKYAAEFGITNRLRICHFLAQALHESNNFASLEENLNYSAQGLLSTFKKYFTPATANAYARKPQKIANRVYANRMGNGNESSGDGYRYRGRGIFQLTGKDNYRSYNAYLTASGMNVNLINNPDLIAKAPGCFKSAFWFWNANGLNTLADRDDLQSIRRRINGGTIGIDKVNVILLRAKLYIKLVP